MSTYDYEALKAYPDVLAAVEQEKQRAIQRGKPTHEQFCEVMRKLERAGVELQETIFDPTTYVPSEAGAWAGGESMDWEIMSLLKNDRVPKDILQAHATFFYRARDRALAQEKLDEAESEAQDEQDKKDARKAGQDRFKEGIARKVTAHVMDAMKKVAPAPAPVKKLEPGRRFWLPNDVFAMRLSRPEFVLYAYLARRAGKSGVAWPGQELIVTKCRMDPKTVTAAIKGLEDKGLLGCRRGSFGRSSQYRLTDPKGWVLPGGADESAGGADDGA